MSAGTRARYIGRQHAHGFGATTTADALDRTIHAADVDAVAAALDALSARCGRYVRVGQACMYTLTPDEHFIIDRHPHDAGIIIIGGFFPATAINFAPSSAKSWPTSPAA